MFAPECAPQRDYARRQSWCAHPIFETEQAIQWPRPRAQWLFRQAGYSPPEPRRSLLQHSVFGIRHAKQLATFCKSHSQIALASPIEQLAREWLLRLVVAVARKRPERLV